MATSSVPPIVFTPAGLVVPTEAQVLAGVQADYNAAFGGNLNPALETPQGQLESSTTAIIGEKNDEFALFVNQVNPDYADGFMQDAIARIYFLTRKPAVATLVTCTCTGLSGVVIPIGTLAQDTTGALYGAVLGGTIPVGGSISLDFAAIAAGPTACPAGSLTKIYRAIPGWDTITNPADGIVGAFVESRQAFAFRRQNSVAANAHGSLQSIYAAVFAVANVLDVYVTENTTAAPITVGPTNYTLAPHSVYVAAVGGTDSDVAGAIWQKKNEGSDYNGNTSVTVTDTSGYSAPLPSYVVKFERPPALPIFFAVTLANNPGLPSDIVAQTKAAILLAFNGADGGARARIGSTLFASRYYGPVSALGPAVQILSLLLGSDSPTHTSAPVGIDQQPTLIAANIAVSVV